jgi:hypothetical protein
MGLNTSLWTSAETVRRPGYSPYAALISEKLAMGLNTSLWTSAETVK